MSNSVLLSALILRTLEHLRGSFEQIRAIREAKMQIPAVVARILLRDIESCTSRLPCMCWEMLIRLREETSIDARLPEEIVKPLYAVCDQRRELKQALIQLAYHAYSAENADGAPAAGAPAAVAPVASSPGSGKSEPRNVWAICRLRINDIGDGITAALHARHFLKA